VISTTWVTIGLVVILYRPSGVRSYYILYIVCLGLVVILYRPSGVRRPLKA